MSKEFLKYNKQLHNLASKKIQLGNKQERKNIKQVLIDNGLYSIINTYKDPFLYSRVPEQYEKGTRFSEIYALYKFDGLLRTAFFGPMATIETKIKSALAFEVSKSFGNNHNDYLNIKNFHTGTDKALVNAQKLIMKLTSIIVKETESSYQNPIQYYNLKYQFVPLLVLVTKLTFGEISFYYSCLKNKEQQAIARRFNLQPKELEKIIKFLNIIRNKCAHHNRLYCHKTDTRKPAPIPTLPLHQKLKIPKHKGQYRTGVFDIAAVLIIFKYFLPNRDFIRITILMLIYTRYLRTFVNKQAFNQVIQTTGLHKNLILAIQKLSIK